ncbi:hypothetical protein CN324_29740 [Bacillus anthracis]|uniref:hypothetical protein n=1 Tax=Bacillus TaxID=1386 RepID=UPI000BEE0B92|nr:MULTISPECIES: hypothetical protein [Bacillus]PED52294.1 hypothetical protein CON50_27235 [Bacillus anthracis]PEF62666.1 hypothetical protein CON33_27905 [Bacillus anthracis]PET34852.1 hypothetical protein CN518_05200 [Bacillus anthracis]PFA47021.1 hypothetical protein CN391_27020 [Bacillus anthracis]PFA96375.1 hypothetical protein CN385_23295 [Bacillus anthracis]
MKKKLLLVFCLSILFILSGCQKEYNGKYVQWGDTMESVNTDKLERNNIPYKVEGNKVYIPEDAFDDAIVCCS